MQAGVEVKVFPERDFPGITGGCALGDPIGVLRRNLGGNVDRHIGSHRGDNYISVKGLTLGVFHRVELIVESEGIEAVNEVAELVARVGVLICGKTGSPGVIGVCCVGIEFGDTAGVYRIRTVSAVSGNITHVSVAADRRGIAAVVAGAVTASYEGEEHCRSKQ